MGSRTLPLRRHSSTTDMHTLRPLALFAALLPLVVMAHSDPRYRCVINLRVLESIKFQLQTERRLGDADVPDPQQLAEFCNQNRLPQCPAGGRYTLGNFATPPTCSIPDHSEAAMLRDDARRKRFDRIMLQSTMGSGLLLAAWGIRAVMTARNQNASG